MSKTKLAVMLFCVAFGLNIFAFVFSKKTLMVEELKNVWLYELPLSASPLDAYPSAVMGPHSGLIGTLFLPTIQKGALQAALADQWTWNEKTREFRTTLRPGLTYSDDTPIVASDWVESLLWAQAQTAHLKISPEWAAFLQMKIEAPDATTLVLKWEKLPKGFNFENFAREVLTHPVSGVFHPSNLLRLKTNELIVKKWISSGPYRLRKWNPKEISMVSRDVFPIKLPAPFFRTLRFQSAPIKNPSCDFMQSNAEEVVQGATSAKEYSTDKDLGEHTVVKTLDEVHVFWVCRSWKQVGSFCSDPVSRLALSQVLAGESNTALQGKTLKFRIPIGSDAFRAEFRKKIEDRMKAVGGTAKEVSYFFKESKDADLELGFVSIPAGPKSDEVASKWMELSSRVGSGAWVERNVIGQLAKFPLMILMKRLPAGDPFQKVFLEPDLEEKKLPL